MRTTIELRPEHRSALLALAVRRGQKGFSGVLEEAIEAYLRGEAKREEHRQAFHSLAGILTEDEAGELERSVEEVRARWR